MKFTFYLFTKDVKTPEQAFREGRLNTEDGYVHLSPTNNNPLPYSCDVYIQYESITIPNWVKPLDTYFQIDEARARNVSNSLVLLIPVEDRLFGVTYGYGFTAINRALIEKDFGKKVVVNEVDPENLRQMNSRDLDTSTRQTSVTTNRASSIHDYKFKTNSDLLTLVAGIPSNKNYAKRLSGSTSLTATMDIDIEDLGDKCKELLDSYHKKDYITPFGFIDRFISVEDAKLINELKLHLAESITKGKWERIFFAFPSGNVNADVISYYKLQTEDYHIKIEDIDGDDIFKAIETHIRTNPTIEGVRIAAFDENNNIVFGEVDFIDYIVYETQIGMSNYLLLDGRWYQIDRDFYQDVTKMVLEIEEIMEPNFLPPKPSDTNEGKYNEKAGDEKGYLLFDSKLYYFNSYDKIEVCDLLTPKFEFICVKNYSRSSTLSHLFSQGMVSGQLLTNLPDYKKKVEEQIISSGLGFSSILEKENREITFVYAIATKKKGRLVETLSFLSKLNLLEASQVLQGLGYKVKVFRIPESGPISTT